MSNSNVYTLKNTKTNPKVKQAVRYIVGKKNCHELADMLTEVIIKDTAATFRLIAEDLRERQSAA